MEIGDAIVLGLIQVTNGALVVVYWLVDHVLLLATIPALYLLVSRAREEQRRFAVVAGALVVTAAAVVPSPIPLIVLAMGWGGVIAVALDKFNPDSLRWRVVAGLAIYAVTALGFTAYAAYVTQLRPEEWAAIFAADEAAATIAQGRSFLSTINVWGLWIIIPGGYFSLLLQGMFVHPPLRRDPAALIHEVRGRGEPDAGPANRAGWRR